MSTLSMLKFRASMFAAVLAFVPTSHGQDVGMLAQVNVPFTFHIASQNFAPGVYTMRMENEHTLQIQGASESGLAMTWVEDNAQAAKTGKAVFHKYGDQYFLSEITVAGKSRHLHLSPSKAESKVRIAQNKTAPAAVELSLLQGSH